MPLTFAAVTGGRRHARVATFLLTAVLLGSPLRGEVPPLLAAATSLHHAGALADAEAAARQASATARAARDTQAQVQADVLLALIRADRGDVGDALAIVVPLARQARGLPAPAGTDAILALARIHQLRGDARRATRALDEAATASTPGGPAPQPVPLLRGLVALAAGDAARAATLLRAVRETAVREGQSLEASTAGVGLARALLAQRAYADAGSVIADTLTRVRPAGHRVALAEALELQGQLLRLSGDTVGAMTAWQAALDVAREIDLPRVMAPVGYALHEGAAALGEHAASAEYLRQHAEARLRLTGEDATRAVVDVLVADADRGPRAPSSGPGLTTDGRDHVIRTSLLGASLSALLLAVVLWRISASRGRRLRRYRQQLDVLEGTVATLRAFDGMLTICAACKDVCDDSGEWTRVEAYLAERIDARFTHSVCPRCEQRMITATDADADLLAVLGVQRPRVPGRDPLQGGFDWPPSADELARVYRETSERDQPSLWG